MKAVRLLSEGLAEQLAYGDAAMPEIGDGQILVRVYYTSVNQIDWKRGSGTIGKSAEPEFPWIPGNDFSGVVEKAGKEVKGFKAGDEVMGCTYGGTYAEFVAAEPGKTVLKPHNIGFRDAAAAAFVSQTAWQAVFTHGELQKGQRVLIHGAAGAVGAYAVQFAHLKGAYVFATATGRDSGFVKSMGADVVIDYLTQDFTGIAKDLDLVIDAVGGEALGRSYALVRPSGRLVTLVGAVDMELAAGHRITAVRMGVKPNAEDLAEIAPLLDAGKVKVDIAEEFPLSRMKEAWEYVLKKDPLKKHGKVLIKVK